MNIKYKNKKISVLVSKISSVGKFTGLMFKKQNNPNLLFDFKKNTRIAIHSIFVFFSFLAVWLDENNNVLEFRIVHPFEFYVKPKKLFFRLIEIPFNDKNKEVIEFFVGKR
jgi:uncharacterized membrane protein (UPF0127 family)